MAEITTTRLVTAPVHAVLPAEDLARAKRFYSETLGLPVEDSVTGREIIVHAGSGTSILIYKRERTKADHTAAEFVVDDLRAVMSDLRAHGVKFEDYDLPHVKTVDGVYEDAGGLAAWFVDSEGNIIALMQMK